MRKSSLIREYVETHVPSGYESSEVLIKERVRCISVNDLIQQNFDDSNIDLLVIDAEGFEREIIPSINFSDHPPNVIFYESHNLGKDELVVERTLLENGYQLTPVIGDTVAVHENFDSLNKLF